MAYENLDQQDREICEAIERGVAEEEIMAQFGVDAEKVASLRSVVDENKGSGDAPAQPAEETPAGEGENTAGEGAPEGDTAAPAPEGGADDAQPEGEQTA